MIFFIDENVSRRIAERLARDDHTVVHGQDVALGKPDTDVLVLAHSLGATVVTEDTDFGELVVWQGPAGVIQGRLFVGALLLCLSGVARSAQPDFIAQTIAANALALPNSFTVMTPPSVCSRPLP